MPITEDDLHGHKSPIKDFSGNIAVIVCQQMFHV